MKADYLGFSKLLIYNRFSGSINKAFFKVEYALSSSLACLYASDK